MMNHIYPAGRGNASAPRGFQYDDSGRLVPDLDAVDALTASDPTVKSEQMEQDNGSPSPTIENDISPGTLPPKAETIPTLKLKSAPSSISLSQEYYNNHPQTTDSTLNEIINNNPEGITVSLYGGMKRDSFGKIGYSNNTNNAEFEKCALAGAQSTKSIDRNQTAGNPIMANAHTSVGESINDVYTKLNDKYKSTKLPNSPDNPKQLKIKNLSLYYHGSTDSLNFPAGSLSKGKIDGFVNTFRDALKSDVHVQLYACWTASSKTGFAATLAKNLGDDAMVYGHTTKGPATENRNAAVFNANGESTHMFDIIFPESWRHDEAVRIWGDGYTNKAYKKLVIRLREYYDSVCGCKNGSSSCYRKDFQACTPDYPRWYSTTDTYSAMGREMFLDPDGAAKSVQAGWRHWASSGKKNGNGYTEKNILKAAGALADTFDSI